ncbi:MAG: nitrogenase component 1 [Spirochaetota bacterium]
MKSITECDDLKHKVITGEREISSLIMDTPGILCKHGCSYMACKGLVLTPISGIFIITHGPVGCSYYSWGGNRIRQMPENAKDDYFSYDFSTNMEESDVIFGGEKKLKQAIKEAVNIFHPQVIAICSTCPVGLIGDDIQSIAQQAEMEYGIKVLSFSCEGFRSIPGYRLANQGIIENVIGTGQQNTGKYPVNIIGEFFNGQRAKEITRIFKKIGYDIVAVLMGDGSYDDLKNAHKAHLNLFSSDKAVADMVKVLHEKFGTNWLKFNFIGMDNVINSLKNIADFFDVPELANRTEALISEELAKIQDELNNYKNKLRNKTAVIFEDEFVSRHYQALLTDLEVNPVIIGNELFCTNGQNEISFLSAAESVPGVSAAKEKGTLRYDTDLEHYHITLPSRLFEEIKTEIMPELLFNYDNGVYSRTDYNSMLIPNLSHEETEHLLKIIKPDIYFPGIKKIFTGVAANSFFCFFKTDQYRFDYGGFHGAILFARDLLMNMQMAVWQNNVAPWKIKSHE